jgi:site-specific DNA recombinase
MQETLDEEERSCKLVHQQLTAQLARLDTQEENLLDLVANGGQSSAKVKQRLNVIQRERRQIVQQLEQTGERLAIGAALIEDALKLLHDPQGLYEQMAPEERRLMNQAVYAKLYVYEDTEIEAILNPPFDELLEAKQALTRPNRSGTHATNRPRTLAGVLLDGGSNKRVMVGVMGLEPTTSTMRT